jgi:hypothetical protein
LLVFCMAPWIYRTRIPHKIMLQLMAVVN